MNRVAFLVTLLLSSQAQAQVSSAWQEGQPVPPGHHVESRVRWSVVGPGFGGFLAMYTASAAVGYAGMNEGAAVAAVPVAGPFLAMRKGNNDAVYAVLGAGQIIGLGVGVAGLLMPKKQLVPDAPTTSELRVVPVASQAMKGFALSGSF